MGHRGLPARLKFLDIIAQGFFQRFRLFNQGVNRVGKLDQVPMGNLGLFAKGVAMTRGIGGIGRPIGVIVFQPAVRAVVYRQPQDGHIIRVHDPVDKADPQPVYNHLGGCPADFLEPSQIGRLGRLAQVRKVGADCVVHQPLQDVDFPSGGKDLKIAKAHKRRCDPTHHGSRLGFGVAIVKHIADDVFTR